MRRRATWLVIALLLLLAGAWLTPSLDPSRTKRSASADSIAFPRYPNRDQYKLMRDRRTLKALPVAPASDDAEPPTPRKRDPLLVALPPRGGMVVFEVKAFVKSPIGRMVVSCLGEDQELPSIEQDGFDFSGFDRMAVGNVGQSGEALAVLTGDLKQNGLTQHLSTRQQRAYGDHAQIFGPDPDHPGAPHAFAIWNGQIALHSDSEAQVIAAIDRLEGRLNEPSTFSPDDAYGDIYGRLDATKAAELLPRSLSDKLSTSDLDVLFHVDATQDVLVAADAYGSDLKTRDLGKILAAGLGAQRFQAAAEGDDRLSELLDLFTVVLYDEGFQINAAFTRSFVESTLGECATRAHRAAPSTPPTAGSGG